MTLALILLFWFCVLEIGYSYTIYPLLLRIAASLFAHPVQKNKPYNPTVAVLIPVYNEEKVIADKLKSVLSSVYPPEKISVWIGSDCSTDRTEQIVETWGDPRVHLFRVTTRSGKAGILNRLVPLVDAEIVVFTDADILFEPDSIALLVESFTDPRVGGVAGVTIPRNRGKVIDNEETHYRLFEAKQKAREALLHSTISAFGPFYAVRKALFVPYHAHTYSNDDVLLPMNVIRQGYRMYFDSRAITYEELQDDIGMEFNRRVRICAGNFQAFFWLLDFLNPLMGWPWFCYISHKVSRWFSPLFLAAGIVSCAILAVTTPILLYKAFFSAGILTVLFGVLHKVVPLPYNRSIFYFLAMNMAALLGFFRFLRGIRSAVWARTERV